MPSSSKAQHAYMAMAMSAKGRAKLRAEGKKPPSAAVAAEFVHADKGRVSKLPQKMRKKK